MSDAYASMERWLAGKLGERVHARVGPIELSAPPRLELLTAQERAAVHGAIAKRVREFVAGRRLAHECLRAFGVSLGAGIGRGRAGAPVWPPGVVGSIAHSRETAVAIAGRSKHIRALGIDVESAAPLDERLWDSILTEKDRATVAASVSPTRAAKHIFCAKEAAYKAQFPLSGASLGFAAMSVDLDWGTNSAAANPESEAEFRATFRVAAEPFLPGDVLAGSIAQFDDTLLSVVIVEPAV